ncbi:hypothetical protein ACWEQK_28790 [Streptomyces parvulus]
MVDRMDSREGFTKGDRVKQTGQGPFTLRDGVVQGWRTYEYAPTKWYCSVTFGGRYTSRYQANEIEHVTQQQ